MRLPDIVASFLSVTKLLRLLFSMSVLSFTMYLILATFKRFTSLEPTLSFCCFSISFIFQKKRITNIFYNICNNRREALVAYKQITSIILQLIEPELPILVIRQQWLI